MFFSTLEQFLVINYNICSFYIPNYLISEVILGLCTIYLYLVCQFQNLKLATKSFIQKFLELCYLFILDVLLQNIGKIGIMYFPIIFNTFYIIYLINLGGMIGYNFQLTSHIFVTFSISISLFIGLVILGIYKLQKAFFNQFLPKDSPKILFPLLVIIETISYLIRPFTLGIRLFANLFSGHVLLFVILSFIIVIFEKKFFFIKLIFFILPILLLFFIMSLEILIMFLQAYVFIILLSVYLNDSLHAHGGA